MKLCERDLRKVVEEFRSLPEDERRPRLAPRAKAGGGRRVPPSPPPGGLILKAYCTYVRRDDDGRVVRSREYYYKENPNRWAAETQSDMLWLREAEWKTLVPDSPAVGDTYRVAQNIQKRFFSTALIDFMEGSVNSLAPRETRLELTVERISSGTISLRLDGYGKMGKPLSDLLRTAPRSRGCEVRVLGHLEYDRKNGAFDRFDIVGIGEAWGNKMNYLRREVRLGSYPWMYGIACELVKGDTPADRIPPYNLLHYRSAGPYFGGR